MFDFISPVWAADAAASGISEASWAILIPLLINGALLAYLFGGLSQRMKAVESDFDKLRLDLERRSDYQTDTNSRFENNLHRMELVLSKIETRFDLFLTAVSDNSRCPLLKDAGAKNAKAAKTALKKDDTDETTL